MQELKSELLRGLWYVALLGADLRPARMVHKSLLGEPVLIGRGRNGRVFALRDICPHRGVPLHYGEFDGQNIACCYHGWRFDMTGTCVESPSLREGQEIDLGKIGAASYPCTEQQGLVWVYFPAAAASAAAAPPPPPRMPAFSVEAKPAVAIMQPFPCSTDHAAFGLMDPTHAGFVHTSWWFKHQATRLRPKEKKFEPIELGWRMVRHPLPPQNLVYKLLGRKVETEISYQLPGLRIEEVHGDRHTVVGLTAITPMTDETTEVHQVFWASARWVKALAPLIRPFMHRFLDQDRQVVVKQREGLLHKPRLMLINDADTQARWWMRIKDEWITAQAEARPFVNPLEAKTLRWRS